LQSSFVPVMHLGRDKTKFNANVCFISLLICFVSYTFINLDVFVETVYNLLDLGKSSSINLGLICFN